MAVTDRAPAVAGAGSPALDARRGRLRTGAVFALLAVALVAAVTLAVSVGAVGIPPGTVWRVVAWHLTGLGDPSAWTAVQADVVWELRLPRALLGALVGAGLAVVGIVIQALVRNPLADPYLLGISQGASVGAVAVIVLGAGAFGVASTSVAAFAGALASFALLYAFAQRKGSMAPLRLVLAGVAVGYALHGVTHYLVLQANTPSQTNTALFWILGSLAKAEWGYLGLPAVVLVAGVTLLVGQARALNALLVGDETAASLGVGVDRLRRQLLVVASLVTAVLVSVSGGIGFVGLVIPHAMRLIVGGDHRRLVVAGALGGGTFMVLADVVARLAVRPTELPIGVVTAVVGAPVFLALMSRRLESGAGT